MFRLLKKVPLAGFLALVSLGSINPSLMGWDCCEPAPCNRLYIGAFGGGIYSNDTEITQEGTAFFTEAEGGPLAVFAEGKTKSNSSGFGGVQLGYEWSSPNNCSDWSIAPAAEAEVFFYRHTKKGHLINPTDRLPEHDFANSFHMNSNVLLANAVFSLKNSCLWGLTPYVGGGIGAARISLHHAHSLQVSPEEAGINHFNSKPNDSSWAFAAQAKAGVRFDFCESFHIFGEYRYLYIDSSNYIFGSTVYETHAPTSPWNVKVKNIHYNAFAIGIQYDL